MVVRTDNGIFVRKWLLNNPDAPVALLLHGLASSSNTWRKLAADLTRSGYSCVAPDMWGHGNSEKRAFKIDDYVKELGSFNQAPSLIVGHSIGGLIAAKLHATYPDAELVLLDPVLNLPKHKLLLFGVRHVFAAITSSGLLKGAILPVIKTPSQRARIVRELTNLKRWDVLTTMLLHPEPKTISQLMVTGKHKMLVLRAKGSYVFPPYILKKTFRENVLVKQINAGHNLHILNYTEVWDTIKTFLGMQYSLEPLTSITTTTQTIVAPS